MLFLIIANNNVPFFCEDDICNCAWLKPVWRRFKSDLSDGAVLTAFIEKEKNVKGFFTTIFVLGVKKKILVEEKICNKYLNNIDNFIKKKYHYVKNAEKKINLQYKKPN